MQFNMAEFVSSQIAENGIEFCCRNAIILVYWFRGVVVVGCDRILFYENAAEETSLY